MKEPSVPRPLLWDDWLQLHPLAHFVYDTDSLRLLAANEAALRRYGYGREEFLRLSRSDLLLPAQEEVLRRFIAALPASALAEPQPVWLERTRDGQVLHADIRGMPVLFEGRPARLAAVVDASDRARLAVDVAVARDLMLVAGRMAQLGAWSVDLRTGRAQWSDVVRAIHEMPPDAEPDLASALRHYPGEAQAQMRAAVDACIRDGTPYDLELPFVSARGTPRWVRNVGAAVRDGSGAIVGLEGAQQDITERKRDAVALAESRERLAALLRALPDLWFVLDAEGRYEAVSREDHPSLTAHWSAMVGRHLGEVLTPEHADSGARLVAAAHASGQTQTLVYRMRTAGGALRSFEARCVPLQDGRTLELIRDITETAELQERFRAMADAAPMPIFMTDPDGGCTYANEAWQRLYGLAGDEALGHAWAGVVHPDDRAAVHREWLGSAASGASFAAEFRLLLRDGDVRSVAARSNPILREAGQVVGHVGTVTDLTASRELEAARRAQAVAEEAGRRQAAFMSRVSHELRTPLNAILGFGQLLEDGGELPAGRGRTYAGHVVQAGRHMLALVDDLLELQHLEQGRLQPERRPVALGPLLAACADLLGPSAQAEGVELVVDAEAGLEVQSDERCLRQIVLNLGSNAIKYGHRRGEPGRVRLQAERAGAGARVRVHDQGPGLQPVQLARLFQPFERLGQQAGGQPGSGLGLVITRQLAQLLGGDVSLQSAPGAGTTATLELPD